MQRSSYKVLSFSLLSYSLWNLVICNAKRKMNRVSPSVPRQLFIIYIIIDFLFCFPDVSLQLFTSGRDQHRYDILALYILITIFFRLFVLFMLSHSRKRLKVATRDCLSECKLSITTNF